MNSFCSPCASCRSVAAYADDSSKDDKRASLGFRPVHFAAVGLPLGDRPANAGGSKTGAFKIEDGNVVGMCALICCLSSVKIAN